MAMEELQAFEIINEENGCPIDLQDCVTSQTPLDVVARGGNELMQSYYHVTQSLLEKVQDLKEVVEEKDRTLSNLKQENERLLSRVHELMVGAELREEAVKSRTHYIEDNKKEMTIHCAFQNDSRFVSDERKSQTPKEWLKLAILLGLTISASILVRDGLDV